MEDLPIGPAMRIPTAGHRRMPGHFLIEAEAKGYLVPGDMLKRWKKYQRNKAQDWRKNQESYSSELIQAYQAVFAGTGRRSGIRCDEPLA